jgi:putative endonuclease
VSQKENIMMRPFYILECADKSFYTGVTSDLERRMEEHNHGVDSSAYTYKRRPVELKWFEEFSSVQQAIEVEKQLKGWSKRKKQALIDKDWDKLIEYSKNYTQFGKGGASTS